MLTQSFALLVDVTIGTATEIDTLEGTGAQLLGRHNLLQMALTVFADDKRLTRGQLTDVFGLQVEGSLQHGTLTGQCDDLVVLIPERRADTPWVAHAEHLARARQTAHHIAAVVVAHRLFQHVGHLHVVVDIVRDGGTL